MTFHAKFGAIGWFFAFNATVLGLEWIHRGRESTNGKVDAVLAILMTAFTIYQALRRYFTYWRLEGTSLHEQRFWNGRDIPYSQILMVSTTTYWGRKPDAVKIDWFRAGDAPKSGRIYADPTRVSQFIQALHQYLPENILNV